VRHKWRFARVIVTYRKMISPRVIPNVVRELTISRTVTQVR
jgi:hypothetical protein